MVNFGKIATVKQWSWDGDHTEESTSTAEEVLRLEYQDHQPQTFSINGDARTFSCVPSKTSNFEVFCLVNENKIDKKQAREIWEYYREKFIIAKMRGVRLTQFRQALEEFVSENYEPTKIIKKNYTISGRIENKAPSRKSMIENYIGLARYLELQYNVDRSIEGVCKGYDVPRMRRETSIFCDGVLEPTDMYSYFKTSPTEETDWSIYEDRKLTIKKVYRWTHRDTYHYICESEFGPVKFSIPRTSKCMIRMFDRLVTDGTEIVVTQAKVMNNIDDTPFLLIERWFIE